MMGDKDRNKISVYVAAAVGLGAIIGAGIFVLSGTAIALAGPYALVAFALVGVLALIIALELGELGALMPSVKGASYSYTYKALGSELGFVTGMMRYLALSASIGAIALGFGSYFSSLFGLSLASYSIPIAIILIFVLSVVNMFGVKKAAQADFWLVMVKISVLLLFMAFAIFAVSTNKSTGLSNLAFNATGGTINGIFAASVAVFFAYSGFQSISTLTDRIKGGPKGYVTAILCAVIISMVLYLLIAVALLLLIPPSSYKIVADPLSYALKSANAPGWLSIAVDIGALVATASAAIAMILTASRSLYQMGVDGLLPKFFRRYNEETDTAENGVIISAIIGVLILFAGNIYIIAAISNFGLMFNYLLIGLNVIHFRRRGIISPFRMPLYPYLPVLSIIMLLAFFAGMPSEALLIGSVMIMALIVVYYLMVEVRKKKPIYVRLFN